MPNGRSLHIGVNYLDPKRYPVKDFDPDVYAIFDGDGAEITRKRYVSGWKGPLGTRPEGKLGCEKDAKDMEEIAARLNLEPRIILPTEEATADRVRREFETAAKELEAGQFFFVTYSGHGAHAKDMNEDEPDGFDETWCLYDRMFLDDEQRVLYSKFAEKEIRIVVLMDCCHSATGFRGSKPADEIILDPNVDIRGASKDVDDWIYRYEANRQLYDEIQKSLDPVDEYLGVISMSACRDDQTAKGNRETGGYFSNAVTAAFADGQFKGNYVEFFEQVKSALKEARPNASQEPKLLGGVFSDGLTKALKQGRPFTDAEWAEEVEILNIKRSREKPKKKPPLRPDEEAAFRRLAGLLAEEFLRSPD